MSAVVKLKIERPGQRTLVSAAVLNGGFASKGPRLLLPARAALVLYPEYPSGTEPVEAHGVGGRVDFRKAKEPVSARVVAEDREGPVVPFVVLIGEQDDEILVSDYGIDALGVKIESHGEGLWRFADEERIRPSVPRQSW